MRPWVLLSLLAVPALGPAQFFPAVPKDGVVSDGANLLSNDDKARIDALSRDFQRDTGAPIAVATLSSLEGVNAKSIGIQGYSTMLFNQWRVGSRQANGGILLVVAKADRKVWVALGKDWANRYDARAKEIVNETIVPAFKREDYSGGIVEGCQALAHLAEGATSSPEPTNLGPTPEGAGGVFPETPDVALTDGPPPVLMLLCCGAPILLFVVFLSSRRRRGQGGFGSPGRYGFGSRSGGPFTGRTDEDDAFLAGMIAGQATQPMYDPAPMFDGGPSYDSGPSDPGSTFDSGSTSDAGSSDSGGFDSGSSDGGGGGGDW